MFAAAVPSILVLPTADLFEALVSFALSNTRLLAIPVGVRLALFAAFSSVVVVFPDLFRTKRPSRTA